MNSDTYQFFMLRRKAHFWWGPHVGPLAPDLGPLLFFSLWNDWETSKQLEVPAREA
jgi:hypothetical protein